MGVPGRHVSEEGKAALAIDRERMEHSAQHAQDLADRRSLAGIEQFEQVPQLDHIVMLCGIGEQRPHFRMVQPIAQPIDQVRHNREEAARHRIRDGRAGTGGEALFLGGGQIGHAITPATVYLPF